MSITIRDLRAAGVANPESTLADLETTYIELPAGALPVKIVLLTADGGFVSAVTREAEMEGRRVHVPDHLEVPRGK